MSRTLHRSYFDLLKEKYPEPGEPGAGPHASAAGAVAADRRVGRRPDVSSAASRQGSWLLAVVLCLLAASLLFLFLGPLELPGADRRASERTLPATPPAAEPRVAEPSAAARQMSPPAPRGARTVEPQAEPRTAELRAPEPGAAAPRVVEAPVEARTAELRSESRTPEAAPAAATAAAATPPPARQAAEPQTPERTGIGVRIFAPRPEYPAAARRLGLEGSVLAEAGVDGSGRVSDVQVVEGSSPELDRAAVEALHRWRFEPARIGGEPLAYRFRQEFRFSIEPAAAPAHRPAEAPPTPAAGDEVTPPLKLATPLPGYTPAAWAAGIEGEVELRATIDERGEVAGVEVVRGLPHGLTEAAVAAVRRWKFRPATRGGEPVAVEHRLSLRFAL